MSNGKIININVKKSESEENNKCMHYVRTLPNGMKVLTGDSKVVDSLTPRQDEFVKRVVCESCEQYAKHDFDKNRWYCMSNELPIEFDSESITVRINGKCKPNKGRYKLLMEKQPIPKNCIMDFEHSFFSCKKVDE